MHVNELLANLAPVKALARNAVYRSGLRYSPGISEYVDLVAGYYSRKYRHFVYTPPWVPDAAVYSPLGLWTVLGRPAVTVLGEPVTGFHRTAFLLGDTPTEDVS